MKKRHRAQIGEDPPKPALRSKVRKYFVWAVGPGGEISNATLPMSRAADLVRHDRFFLTAPQVDSGGAKTEPTLPKVATSPNYLVAPGLRSSRVGKYHQVKSEDTRPK